MKKSSFLSGTLLFMFLLTSCIGNVPASTPTVDPSAVAAVVSTMLAGNSTAMPLPQPTATLTPEPATVLPRSLYYLAQDANGKGQIFRLGRDGVTITQITSESDGILNFDVSAKDGTLAFPAQNNLITVDASGTNRKVLAQDPNIRFSVTWSPDGRTIAYGDRDMVLYSLDTGSSKTLIAANDQANIMPEAFSPDGTKIITRKFNSKYIYDITSQTLIPVNGKFCHNAELTWNTSNTFFCFNHVFAGGGMPGLWQAKAIDGSVQPLIFSASCPPCLPVAAPHQGGDGNLYYFYGEVNDVNNIIHPPLMLIQSALDGVSGRAAVRPEIFNVASALWTPDDKAVLIIQTETSNDYPKSLILVPLNSSLPIVNIMADASRLARPYTLRWGP